jgi:hypothetical protein
MKALSVLLGMILSVSAIPSVRYLHGRFEQDMDGVLATHRNITIAEAWRYCQQNQECVSFGFKCVERFPGEKVSVRFYPYADWHISLNGENIFVNDDFYHLYINATREESVLSQEVSPVFENFEIFNEKINEEKKRVKGESLPSSLRKSQRVILKDNDNLQWTQDKINLLFSLVGVLQYRELRVPCVNLMTTRVLKIAMEMDETPEVRNLALQIVLAFADSYETPPILTQDYGLLDSLQRLLEQQQIVGEWDPVSKTALDIVSNLALHRSPGNPFQPPPSLIKLLKEISQSENGSVGFQAALALIHSSSSSSNEENQIFTLVGDIRFKELVDHLEATIDKDPIFGYDWDLIPGPLSAIELVIESNGSDRIIEILLEAGLMEQLVRILEADILDAQHVYVALHVMELVRTLSPSSSEILAMVAHSIHNVKIQLEMYQRPAALAGSLAKELTKHHLCNYGMDKEL